MPTFNSDMPEDVRERLDRGETAIRAYRLHHHMPIADLALRAGVSSVALEAAENGIRPLENRELKRVADALAIPVARLDPAMVATTPGNVDEKTESRHLEEPHRD